MTIAVDIADDRWLEIPDIEALVERAILASLGKENAKESGREISVLLANDKEIKGLNKRWRGKNKPTNVLSFPAAAPPSLASGQTAPLGDIVLAIETVAAEALAAGKPIEHHVLHLVIHGVLHLLGYDHQTGKEGDAMEQREADILAGFGIPNPYES